MTMLSNSRECMNYEITSLRRLDNKCNWSCGRFLLHGQLGADWTEHQSPLRVEWATVLTHDVCHSYVGNRLHQLQLAANREKSKLGELVHEREQRTLTSVRERLGMKGIIDYASSCGLWLPPWSNYIFINVFSFPILHVDARNCCCWNLT